MFFSPPSVSTNTVFIYLSFISLDTVCLDASKKKSVTMTFRRSYDFATNGTRKKSKLERRVRNSLHEDPRVQVDVRIRV